jgi:hypothetical protein
MIDEFEELHGEPHLLLAYHAAFPLGLTPGLLYLIWGNFQNDLHGQPMRIPWIAVADLLLSPFCRELSGESYVILDVYRHALLNRMWLDPRFRDGERHRIAELAGFMRQYARRQSQSQNPLIKEEATAQQLNALVHLLPEKALQILRRAYQKGVTDRDEGNVIRLGSLMSTFAETTSIVRLAEDPIRKDYEALNTYAQGMVAAAQGQKKAAEVDQELREELSIASDSPLAVAGDNMPSAFILTGEATDAAELDSAELTSSYSLAPGETVLHTWRVKNTGTGRWQDGYTAMFVDGFQMGAAERLSFSETGPGETVDITVELTAPRLAIGHYHSVWRLQNRDGVHFGPQLNAQVQVSYPRAPIYRGIIDYQGCRRGIGRYGLGHLTDPGRTGSWENNSFGEAGGFPQVCTPLCFTG